MKSIPCWFRPEAHTAVASRYLQPPTEGISQHHPVAARQRGVRRLPAYVQIDGQRVVRPPAQLDQDAPGSRPGPVSAYLHTELGGTAAERRPLLASRHATYGRNPPSRRRGGGGRHVSTAAGTVSRALRDTHPIPRVPFRRSWPRQCSGRLVPTCRPAGIAAWKCPPGSRRDIAADFAVPFTNNLAQQDIRMVKIPRGVAPLDVADVAERVDYRPSAAWWAGERAGQLCAASVGCQPGGCGARRRLGAAAATFRRHVSHDPPGCGSA